MGVIIKNYTADDVVIGDLGGVTIPANGSVDLQEEASREEIANSDDLLQLLAEGVDKYQVNDGSRDLSFSEGIDYVRRIFQRFAVDSQGIMRAAPAPVEGSSVVIVTPNWCDKTTWYSNAKQVIGEVLANRGDDLQFIAAHDFIIDVIHGKLFKEDVNLTAYKPVVYVDGQAKQEAPPDITFFCPGNGFGDYDYWIDYRSGIVHFFEPVASGAVVTMDYWYATDSIFIIAPSDGKVLRVLRSEVQFSSDVCITDSVKFQAWAYDPANPPNKIPVTPPTVYKTAFDYASEANGTFPMVAAFGGSGTWRGIAVPILTYPWLYVTSKDLRSSQGLEIRIWLENHREFRGSQATAAFYCISEDE